jgi:hypothetical protein
MRKIDISGKALSLISGREKEKIFFLKSLSLFLSKKLL